MEENRDIFREIILVAIGELICVAIMLGVFALVGHFYLNVLLGGLLGWVLTVANFFLMAVGVTAATKKAANQDVAGAQRTLQLSMAGRYLMLIVLLAAAALSRQFNLIALVLPLLFFRPILAVGEFFRKSGDSKV